MIVKTIMIEFRLNEEDLRAISVFYGGGDHIPDANDVGLFARTAVRDRLDLDAVPQYRKCYEDLILKQKGD